MIGRIILGLIGMTAGFYFVIKTEVFLNNFGRLPFFEKYLGSSGGSRLGYKIFGIVLIIIGFMIATGFIGGFITWMISPLTKYSQPIY